MIPSAKESVPGTVSFERLNSTSDTSNVFSIFDAETVPISGVTLAIVNSTLAVTPPTVRFAVYVPAFTASSTTSPSLSLYTINEL